MTALLWLYAGLIVGAVIGWQMRGDATEETRERKPDLTQVEVGGAVLYLTHRMDSGELIRK